MEARLLDLSTRELLHELAQPGPVPAGGSAAALAIAMGAAVLAMAARVSRDHWDDAASCAAQAETLRLRAAPLAQSDAEAFGEVIRLRADDELPPAERDRALGKAFRRSAEIPLRIAEAGADVAELAAHAAARVDPKVHGDAAAAALLAEAGARVAAHLVAINLGASTNDARVERAREAADAASRAARAAIALEG